MQRGEGRFYSKGRERESNQRGKRGGESGSGKERDREIGNEKGGGEKEGGDNLMPKYIA